MHYLTTLLLTIILTNTVYAQGYINSTKSASKRVFEMYMEKHKYQATINETDFSLTFLLRDPKVQNLDIVLHFDNRGKCDSEVQTLSCDSCYHKYLNNILASDHYRWKQVDPNTYFAKSRKRLILTTGLDKPFSIMIRRSALSKREYRQIINDASNK